MNSKKLTFRERISAVFVYIFLLISALWYLSGSLSSVFTEGTSYNYVLVSAGLLLIFGVYIAEPYFAKPTDVLVNLSAIILFVLGLPEGTEYLGRSYILYTSLLLLGLTVIVIFAKEQTDLWRLSNLLTDFLIKVGQSKVSFSLIYLVTIYSFFGEDHKAFVLLFSFWVLFISAYWVESVIRFISSRVKAYSSDEDIIGRVSSIENSRVFSVERFYKKDAKAINVGDSLEVKSLDNKTAAIVIKVTAALGREIIQAVLMGDTVLRDDSLISKSNKISVQSEGIDSKKVVGYVEQGSDVQKINIRLFNQEVKVTEGSIVSVEIRGVQVLYQIFGALTKNESIDHSSADTFFIATARKLGHYNEGTREISNVKWLPEMYTPVITLEDFGLPKDPSDIGELPSSDYPVKISDFNHLVTHNTAILGILGVGKSCLTFELLQKVVSQTSVKVVCLDITGEYTDSTRGLPRYVSESIIESDAFEGVNEYLNAQPVKTDDSKDAGGNVDLLRTYIHTQLNAFMTSEKRIMVINPEEILAIQQAEHAKNRNKNGVWEMYAPFAQLSVAEITRVVSEVALDIARALGMQREAKLLLVFEEAHSLIPEWNSAANEGDRVAANGTARVILQGRKYGLGSFVITQRTANISKTILNQCNTIFAFKIFDDTGKQFLENYVGSDYANVLPNLDDRHVVATGKALKLKQPVIVLLNDRDNVMLPVPDLE